MTAAAEIRKRLVAAYREREAKQLAKLAEEIRNFSTFPRNYFDTDIEKIATTSTHGPRQVTYKDEVVLTYTYSNIEGFDIKGYEHRQDWQNELRELSNKVAEKKRENEKEAKERKKQRRYEKFDVIK